MEKSKKPKRKTFPKGSQRKGYVRTAPSICCVVHDLGGMPINDKIANEILDAVTEVAINYGYVVNWSREG